MDEEMKEYIEKLEQEEAILDKVKEFANRIVTENTEKYNSKNQKEADFSEWNLALEILNIIEGDLKIMDKEELKKEDIEIAKEDLNFIHEGDYITEEMEHSADIIEEYIEELEQKEAILNKVKEFIKEDITTEDIKVEGSKLFKVVYKDFIDLIKEKIIESVNSYKKEIENIIEGENK